MKPIIFFFLPAHPITPGCTSVGGVNDFHTLPKAQLIPLSRVQPVTKLCQLPLLNIFWQSKKKARHKRPHIVGVYLYGMSRTGKCRETEVDWWLPGAGGGGNGEQLLIGDGVSFWGDENILELDRSGGGTTL